MRVGALPLDHVRMLQSQYRGVSPTALAKSLATRKITLPDTMTPPKPITSSTLQNILKARQAVSPINFRNVRPIAQRPRDRRLDVIA